MAEYWTVGHLFELHCRHWGHEEAGSFSPVVTGMPEPEPLDVYVDLLGLPPTAKNLSHLAKLHSQFCGLRAAQLKQRFLEGPRIYLGAMHRADACAVERAAQGSGFTIETVDRQGASSFPDK
ncbi:hypothetical protein OOT46_28055 [Aquabacterium sp. A7-Y]|uniref:hypothetical protein n=1 Tax=Aquabacterium sp. A7-Y TaxID=1349605 RepID=UPI00223CFBEB|nr:hypothetical protein [Aquabacterium sp. A7-Y]MCW7541658.1 hypothetical protein [Aquabacterium sp. A7-Y]